MNLFELIPPFDFREVFVIPWLEFGGVFVWIFLMGFFVTAGCGLLGVFLVWRRMALVGDAISHSVLPGIMIAFLLTQSRDTLPMFIGALAAGVVATFLIEFIHQKSRVKSDAALGIVFTTFFAAGVLLVSVYGENVDLDTDCILYGEIEYIPDYPKMRLLGMVEAPTAVVRMGAVGLLAALGVVLFYKQLLVSSFDPGLARSIGYRPGLIHHGLMCLLAIAVVSAFEAVGAVLVIAMLIFPGTTASLLSNRLPRILWMTVGIALIVSFLGLHLALWLNASTAASMSVVAAGLFGLAWAFSPQRGLLGQALSRWRRQRPAAGAEAALASPGSRA